MTSSKTSPVSTRRCWTPLRFALRVAAAAFVIASPAVATEADAPKGASQAQASRRGPTGSPAESEALESMTIIAGTVADPREPRWREKDAAKPVLPVVAEDAFLDGEPDRPADSPRR